MPVIEVQTANGPVLVDEDGIEAWGGQVIAEQVKPKRGKAAQATNAPADFKAVEGGFVLVDAEGAQVGSQVFATEEEALAAITG